jgi:hypothetical protein
MINRPSRQRRRSKPASLLRRPGHWSRAIVVLFLAGAAPAALAQEDRCYPGLDCPEDLPHGAEPRGGNAPPGYPPARSDQGYPYPEGGPTYPPQQTQGFQLPSFCCTLAGRFGPLPNYGAGPGEFCWIAHPLLGQVYGQACY